MHLVGKEKLHKVRSLFSHDGPYPMTVDLVHSLMVHIRATVTYLTKLGVLEFVVYVVHLSELGLEGKTLRFLAWRTRVLGKEFASDRGRLLSRQKTAVFLLRQPGEALD